MYPSFSLFYLKQKHILTPTIRLWANQTASKEITKSVLSTLNSNCLVLLHAVADEASRGYIGSAISEWSGKTCLQFREKTYDDEDYIEFVYEVGYVHCSPLKRNQLTFFSASELNWSYSPYLYFILGIPSIPMQDTMCWSTCCVNNFHSEGQTHLGLNLIKERVKLAMPESIFWSH